jgi:hypothetical protein
VVRLGRVNPQLAGDPASGTVSMTLWPHMLYPGQLFFGPENVLEKDQPIVLVVSVITAGRGTVTCIWVDPSDGTSRIKELLVLHTNRCTIIDPLSMDKV